MITARDSELLLVLFLLCGGGLLEQRAPTPLKILHPSFSPDVVALDAEYELYNTFIFNTFFHDALARW